MAPEGHLHEKPGTTDGIPGLFYFPKAVQPAAAAARGGVRALVRRRGPPDFACLDCPDLKELGDFSTIETSNERAGFSRFFNKVEMGETLVTKTVIDPKYEELHRGEVAWYAKAERLGFRRIPQVHSHRPWCWSASRASTPIR